MFWSIDMRGIQSIIAFENETHIFFSIPLRCIYFFENSSYSMQRMSFVCWNFMCFRSFASTLLGHLSFAAVIFWFSDSDYTILKSGKIVGAVHVISHKLLSRQWMPGSKCTCRIDLIIQAEKYTWIIRRHLFVCIWEFQNTKIQLVFLCVRCSPQSHSNDSDSSV